MAKLRRKGEQIVAVGPQDRAAERRAPSPGSPDAGSIRGPSIKEVVHVHRFVSILFDRGQFICEAGSATLGAMSGDRTGSVITRFAPSPSGYLHLGHAYAAFVRGGAGARGRWRRSCCASRISTPGAAGPNSRRRSRRIWLGSGSTWPTPVRRQTDHMDGLFPSHRPSRGEPACLSVLLHTQDRSPPRSPEARRRRRALPGHRTQGRAVGSVADERRARDGGGGRLCASPEDGRRPRRRRRWTRV